MSKINKMPSSETNNVQGGKSEITEVINDQLIHILPIQINQGDIIGKEIPGIPGIVTKILGYHSTAYNELTRIETSEGKKCYLYPDGTPVYIKNPDGTNTQELVDFYFQLIHYKGREISNGNSLFYTDTFERVQTINDLGRKAIVYEIHEDSLGAKKCLQIVTVNREHMVDQKTGEILRVEGKSINHINDYKPVKINDRILQNVHLNKGGNTWIFTDTMKEVKIEGIDEHIQKISLGKYNMYPIFLGPYQVVFVQTDKGKAYLADINTMKVLKLPGIDFDIDAEKLINIRFDSDSYANEIVGNEFNIFQKEICSIPLCIPHLKGSDGSKNISIYKESGLPVKVPGTELLVCSCESYYTNAKVINGEKYGGVVVLDTEKGRNTGIYLREGDLSILEAILLNGKKVMINSLLDEDDRTLFVDGREIITIGYDKHRLSALVDKHTFEEVTIKVAGTEEKINYVYHHIFTLGGEEVKYVRTTSGKTIYLYKKNLAPLQIPGIKGYVEDITELEDGKRNMKVNGKWNLVRIK